MGFLTRKGRSEGQKQQGNLTLSFSWGCQPARHRQDIVVRTIQVQLDRLSESERQCFDELKSRWEMRCSRSGQNDDDDDDNDNTPSNPFSDEVILRFARCAPAGPFVTESAWKVMKKCNPRYMTLTARELKAQLQSKTLFPLPYLETVEGNEVFYMRPSRYFPNNTPTQDVIDNLVYVMNSMNEKERNASNGIAFIANMDGWTMNNFSIDYCFQFMMKLQGSVPTRVTHFLIVNPPSWFGKIWTIMRKMLLPSFQKKVHMIREQTLGRFLKPGYQTFLPSEMSTGQSPTNEIVQDYIDERLYREACRGGGVSDARSFRSVNVVKSITVSKISTISETENTESERTDMLDLSTLDLGTISEQLGVDEPVAVYKRKRSLRRTAASSWRTN